MVISHWFVSGYCFFTKVLLWRFVLHPLSPLRASFSHSQVYYLFDALQAGAMTGKNIFGRTHSSSFFLAFIRSFILVHGHFHTLACWEELHFNQRETTKFPYMMLCLIPYLLHYDNTCILS